MKSRFLPLFVTLFLLFQSCASEDPKDVVPVSFQIEEVKVYDVSNSGNASDLKISFTKVAAPELVEYRVAIIEAGNELSIDEFVGLDAGTYEVISSSALLPHTISAGLLDSEGNPIVEGKEYQAQLLAISSNTSQTATKPSSIFELAQTDIVRTLASNFSASGGIAVDDSGNIYVADFGTGDTNGTEILKFSADGTNLITFADGLLGPTGGAFDSNDDLFWSSYSGNKVHKISSDGQIESFANIPGPAAIVVVDDGTLFVASCDGNSISRITSGGNVSTFATSPSFNCPNGLTRDSTGNLYTCNFEDGNIFKISSSGQVAPFARIASGSSVNMKYHGGYLYVTGRNTHTIYRVSIADASVETLAGTGFRGKFDAAASDATFSLPNGIAISPDGTKIYINDVDPNSGTNVNGPNFNPNTLRVIELNN